MRKGIVQGIHALIRAARSRKRQLLGVLLGLTVLQGLWIGFAGTATLPLFDDPYSTVLVDRNGKLLGAAIASDEQWRFPPAETVPARFARALVCYEDRRFYRHPGVDPLAVLRALGQNLRTGEIVSGASTLSMQVIRLSRKTRPRTIREKMTEAVLALRLETRLTKDEILVLYAAHAPFGGNVVGLSAAAWRYFGRPAGALSWAEASMLAVLPNSPGLIHPGKNRKRLKERRDRLLMRLQEEGVIDAITCRLARAEPLPSRPHPMPMSAPHLLFRARSNLGPENRGALIQTTLDKKIQVRTNQILARHLAYLARSGIHNAGALILEVDTGAVLAYVGNAPDLAAAGHENHVDVITAARSTGSILKPLLYAGMLQAGELLPTQLVADVPTRMGGFRPENYTRRYSGAIPAWMALSRSLNIPAVRMLRAYGVDRFCSLLRSLDMTTLHRPAHEYGLSLILGGAEATLWEITGIYAGMARSVNRAAAGFPSGGAFFSPRYLKDEVRVGTRQDPDLLQAGACWLTLEAMVQVTRPGVESSWRAFGSARRIAWKTGTSYGHRDAWAVGVTPRYAVGVWAGNADGEGRPELTGIGATAPILFEIFGILEDGTWFGPPGLYLEEVPVCRSSGHRAGPYCAETEPARIPFAGLESPPCPYCRIVHTNARGNFRVHGSCESLADLRKISWFVLPPAMEWYYRKRHADYRPIPPLRQDCRGLADAENASSMTLIYPSAGSEIYIPLELDGRRGRTVFEAAHRDRTARIYWHLDRDYLGVTQEIHTMGFAPAPGFHKLTLVDENGERIEHTFTVMSREKQNR